MQCERGRGVGSGRRDTGSVIHGDGGRHAGKGWTHALRVRKVYMEMEGGCMRIQCTNTGRGTERRRESKGDAAGEREVCMERGGTQGEGGRNAGE